MLVTINGKEYGYFYRHKPIYKEVEKLIDLCGTGTPREVLSQVKVCGFDSEILKRPFLIHEASPIPVHPMGHPFTSACRQKNLPIVRLMLVLGADPDAEWYHTGETVRQKYAVSPQVEELFEGGKCWWTVEYPDAKKQALQGELERTVLAGEASEVLWLMVHGVRLPSPALLASAEFGKHPRAFKELVCRMGIPDQRLDEFHAWLKENSADADLLAILGTLLQTKGEEGGEAVNTLLLSVRLIGEDKLEDIAVSGSSLPVQISMLQHFISEYDASKHKAFIEKTLAALFKEILCKCMEV